MGFWIIAAILCFATVALVLPPLLGPRRRLLERAAYDLEVYRDQLDEIERDRARGVIGAREAAAARTEIQRRIIIAGREAGSHDATAQDTDAGRASGGSLARLAGIAVLILVPVAAIAVYNDLGNPGIGDFPLAARQNAPAAAPAHPAGAATNPNAPAADMETLVARLAQRMRENPGNPRGWLLLARSYATVGRADRSVATLRDAKQRFPEDHPAQPRFAIALVEALVRLNDGEVVAEAREILEAHVATAPEDPRPAYYLGLSAAQRGNLREAYDRWSALAHVAPADADWLPGLRQQIARIAADLGVNPKPPGGAAPSRPGPTAEQMAAASQMPAEERQAMIQGMVDGLATRLEDDPDDIEGWLRLLNAYTVLGQRDRAVSALAAARRTFASAPNKLARIDAAARGLGL